MLQKVAKMHKFRRRGQSASLVAKRVIPIPATLPISGKAATIVGCETKVGIL